MIEYVKFNCHVLKKNEVGNKTPDILLSEYIKNRRYDVDMTINGVDCIVVSVKYSSGRSSIITKILRKKDIDLRNENLRDQQESQI